MQIWIKVEDYLTVVLRGWLNKENKIRSLLRRMLKRQEYLTVDLRRWLNKENKIRSLLRMNVKKTGLPKGGPEGVA